MKKVIKTVNCILIFLIIFAISSNVFAFETEIKMKVIQKNSEPSYFEEDFGSLTHEIVSCNENTGEINAELKVNNLPNSEDQRVIYDETEIIIMLPENIVVANEKGESKLEEYSTYIETLINKIKERASKTKIGIVGIKGTIADTTVGEDGRLIVGDNDEAELPGSADNAEVVITPTDDVTAIKNAILNMNSSKTKYRINLEAAIHLAKESFSENVNKILISLYDTVPAIANGVNQIASYGGWSSPYSTIEEAVIAKHEDIVKRTKAEILSLKDKYIDLILLRPEDTDFDEQWYNTDTGEKGLDFDGSPYVLELYGTLEKPNYGKMYSLTNESLEQIVTNDIYNDIIEKTNRNMSNVVLTNTFTKEILDNFDITFKTQGVEFSGDTCTLNIGDLNTNETASIEYTLKIKDMNNQDILDKIINISDGALLTYTNSVNETKDIKLVSSPKIELATVVIEVEDQTNQTTPQKPDNSTAPGVIPQTGFNYMLIIIPIAIIVIALVSYNKYHKYKDI